jgi:hypothetical protein
MKRLLLLLTAVLLLGTAFFVAWPGWAAYEVYTAIQAKDAATLERKFDLPSVRASLRAAAAEKIAQLYVPAQSAPTSPVLAERLKREAVERLVANALENLVTPYSLLLLASEGGPLKASVERMLRDQMGRADAPKKVGPVTTLAPGQSATKPGAGSPAPAAPKRGPVVRTISSEDSKSGAAEAETEAGYGLRNLKSFSVLGPFRYEIGIAKDRKATTADVLVVLGFTGLDWKITSIKPVL